LQHKKIKPCQHCLSIYFLCCSRATQRFLKVAPEKSGNLYCHLLTVGQWHRLRQQGSFANLLFLQLHQQQFYQDSNMPQVELKLKAFIFNQHRFKS